MKNLWDQKTASRLEENSLQLRVYSSQLLGLDSDLVLHGGGTVSYTHLTLPTILLV